MNLLLKKRYSLLFVILLLSSACMKHKNKNNETYVKIEAIVLKYKTNSWRTLSERDVEENGDSTVFKVISPKRYKNKNMTYFHKIPSKQPANSIWSSIGATVVFYVKEENIVKAPLGSNYEVYAIKRIRLVE